MAFLGTISDEQRVQLREQVEAQLKKMEMMYVDGALRQRELEKQIEMLRRELCVIWPVEKTVRMMGAEGAAGAAAASACGTTSMTFGEQLDRASSDKRA